METMDSTITQHLEGFIQTARKLESALADEKRRSQKIAQEYLSTRTTLENAVRELQNRLIQRESRLQAISESHQNLQSIETRLKSEIRDRTEREDKLRNELSQYQSAWNEVLARESQARGALIELEKAKATLQEQRNHIQNLETKILEINQTAATHSRHAETYQRELQSALIRIQSSEAKYSQIQKELSALSQSKRNADEEIARIELSMKERFRWELATEKEKIRAELEKDSVLDRERFREVARSQMRMEAERLITGEKTINEELKNELERAKNQINEVEAKKNLELERAQTRVQSLTDEIQRLKEENTATQNELAIRKLETLTTLKKYETNKKEINKGLLIERLRYEEEIREARIQIENLLENGIYIEKIEAAPAGVRIHSSSLIKTTLPLKSEATFNGPNEKNLS